MELAGQKIISINDVSLKSVSVEIKALTLSGKQMTLSVFRQLKRVEAFQKDSFVFNGTPWGTVNYFWDKDIAPSTLHLVLQHGDSLFRAYVYRPDMRDYVASDILKKQKEIESLNAGRVLDYWKTPTPEELKEKLAIANNELTELLAEQKKTKKEMLEYKAAYDYAVSLPQLFIAI